jgi:hypothetical protein
MPINSDEKFYEWEGIGENWITKEDSFDSEYPSKPQKEGDPVAKWVIEDVFDLTLADDYKTIGSTLPGYDVIGRDPYDVIRLSLIADVVKEGIFYECYMDGEGIVRYYSIGVEHSDIGRHILYSIDNGEMQMKCDNVMVTGYDPPPKRYAGNVFNLLTFANNIPNSDDQDLRDWDRGSYPFYTTFAEVLGPEACPFKFEGAIEYGGNPDTLDDVEPQAFEDLLVYNPDEFESVVNYFYKIEVDFFDHYNTTVSFSDTSVRYQELDGFGKLQTRNWVSNDRYISKYCLENRLAEPDPDVGVRLPRSNEYKFKGVAEVYIYGYKLKSLNLNYTISLDKEKINDPVGSKVFVATLDTMLCEPFKLTKDEDYTIVQDPTNRDYSKIVFSCNVSENWLPYFGGSFSSGDNIQFRVSERCLYKNKSGDIYSMADYLKDDTQYYRIGYLSDQRYTTEVDSREFYNAVIFPTGEGSSGYVVEKIIVVYQWNNPSIVIKDLRNDIDSVKLKNSVRASFYPMILKDDPAPIAFSGPGDSSASLLDQNEVRPDYDPTTAQNFQPTEYARAMSSMEAGDIRVSMPFADGEECISIATKIKEMQTDVAHNVVYMCSPDAEPVLGQIINDGVINEIDYSYQDSSQYLISVTVGPKWHGGGSWDNSLYKMETDNPVLTGTVLKISADNVRCNVRINKIGVMECINGTRDLLGVGDKVKVTLYNNPVSL